MMNFLSVIWDVNPVIFSIGSIQIKYYSILFVIGLYPIGYWIVKNFYKREGVPVKLMEPLLYALLIGTLVGARLGHVLFYDPVYYFSHPWKILMTWEGGLASHGGVIGCMLALWWYVNKYGKKYGFDYLWVVDRVVIAASFAACLIRLGNLFNSEIYGNRTDLPWGFIFVLRGETVPKHPTQLYEALSYLILGISLYLLYRYRLKKLKRGEIFGIFFIVLFTMRFLIEFIKEPQEAFEQGMALNMGQILSIPFIVAGIVILILSIVKGRPAILTETEHNNAKYSSASGNKPKEGKQPKKKIDLTHVHPND